MFTIYNNTPWNLMVELKDGEIVWVPGTPLHIDRDMQQRLIWLDEEGRRFPVLSIHRDDMKGRYRFTSPDYPIPEKYIGKRFGSREYRFQLQQDWNLYLMQPEDSYPAPGKHLRLQPPGFPKGRDRAGE